MRIKTFLLIVAIGALGYLISGAAQYTDIRPAGTSGYITSSIDTSDTASDGTLAICDTFYSDTLTVADSFDIVNIQIDLRSIDTGDVLDDDSTVDLFVVYTKTYASVGGPVWTIYADTFDNVNDSARHHFYRDTLCYNKIYWETHYWDTLNPTTNDINTFYFHIDAWTGTAH